MKARALRVLSSFTEDRRRAVLSEGLNIIVENVQSLVTALAELRDDETQRGYKVVRSLAEEEAAKYLIILDYFRLPSTDSGNRSRQLKHFYSHFSRLLYAEYCGIRPSSRSEVCRFVENERPLLFLDGPNDFDWIFRNRLIQDREQELYVDYVEIDDEYRWLGPRDLELSGITPWDMRSDVITLVLAMNEIGFSSESSLEEIHDVWRSFELRPDTHWQEIRRLNKITVRLPWRWWTRILDPTKCGKRKQ